MGLVGGRPRACDECEPRQIAVAGESPIAPEVRLRGAEVSEMSGALVTVLSPRPLPPRAHARDRAVVLLDRPTAVPCG
jgi:hypothetical protein